MVRCGIAIYGMDPFGRDPAARGLEPALELSSYVAEVKRCAAGRERRLRPPVRRRAATPASGVLPLGYGDGWRRGALQQRRRAHRRAPPSARRHREHGQRHRRSRRATTPRARAARRARDPDRHPGRRADHRRGGRAAPETINYEVTCGAHARACRASITATARRCRRGARRRRGGRSRAAPDERARSRPPARRSPASAPGSSAAPCATALLGRASGDLDVVVEGDPARAARAIAARRAAARPASRSREEFGSWRVVARDRSWQLDVEPLRGGDARGGPRAARLHRQRDRRAAAGRRADRPARRRRATSRARRLRMAGAGRLRGRPAARAAPRAGRRRARARARRRRRSRGARAQAPELREVSAERVFAELRRILAAPDARAAASSCWASSAPCAAVLPELEALRGVEQSRFHHLDVYGHTLEVLERTVELDAAEGAGARASCASCARRARRRRSRRCWPSRSPTSSRAARRCAGARCCTTPPSR